MVAVMTMTPVYMQTSKSSINAVGFVIAIHIGSMYLPSLVTGRITDRIGAYKMGLLSVFTLLVAMGFTYFSPAHAVIPLTIGLSLLGLGWNLGLISGTTLIVEASPLSKRPDIQGKTDVLIAIGGSLGGAISGYLVSKFQFSGLSLISSLIILLLGIYIYSQKTYLMKK